MRIRAVGIRGFQGDDFFSMLVLIFYAMDAATVHLICEKTTEDTRHEICTDGV